MKRTLSRSPRRPAAGADLFVRVLLFFCCFQRALAGDAASSVLVLNSDRTVEKYFTAQRSFQQSLGAPVIEIDLGKRGTDERLVQKTLDERNPKLIYCIGSKAYLLAHKIAAQHTIIVSSTINWKRLPLGSRTFGVAEELPATMQATYFRHFFPDLQRIGILYSRAHNQEWAQGAIDAGREVGLQMIAVEIERPRDASRALADLFPRIDALWLIPDPVVLPNAQAAQDLFNRAQAAKKPILTYSATFVDLGACFVISPDTPTIGRQAAHLVKDLEQATLQPKGFQDPAGSEIVLNLRQARAHGVRVNEDALANVNRIIR